MQPTRIRPAVAVGLALIAGAFAGCDAVGKLFAEKPPLDAGRNGPPRPPPDGDHLPPRGPVGVVPALVSDQPCSDRLAFPAGTPVGSWVRYRVAFAGRAPSEEEWAVIGAVGESRWVERQHAPFARDDRLVDWLLVDPRGAVSLAVRGRPGAPPEARLAPSATFRTPGVHEMAVAGEDARREEEVEVPAGRFRCRVVSLDGGEGTAWVADGVPFHGLVRWVYGDPADQDVVELIAHGGDREGAMTGGLPAAPEPGDPDRPGR